jgi:hypothetical protein
MGKEKTDHVEETRWKLSNKLSGLSAYQNVVLWLCFYNNRYCD